MNSPFRATALGILLALPAAGLAEEIPEGRVLVSTQEKGVVDLTADDVYFRTAQASGGARVDNPTDGQTLYAHFRFTTNFSVNTRWQIKYDGVVLCQITTGMDFYAAQWTAYCLNAKTVHSGSHTLTGIIDPADSVAEGSEANNTVTRNLNVSGGGGPPPAGFYIHEGMSGSFFDPNFNGQGINIEILNDQVVAKQEKGGAPGTFLIYWYSFDRDGYPFWSFGVGSFTGATMTVTMLFDYDGAGPFFGPGWLNSDFSATNFATVNINWSNCNSGTMTFNALVSPFDGQEHTLHLGRLTSVAGLTCP